MEYFSQVDSGGRIVIPKLFRDELGIKKGTKIMIELKEGEIHIKSTKQIIKEARNIVKKYCKDIDLLDELKKLRKEEND